MWRRCAEAAPFVLMIVCALYGATIILNGIARMVSGRCL